MVRGRPKQVVQEEMRRALRRRLLWHAEQFGLVALSLYAMLGVTWMARAL
jgi:hypothetical protein